jgi:hypothetical protein
VKTLVWLAIVTFAGVMIFVPRVAQPQEYHQFADQRRVDALTSLPFIAIGAAGLAMIRRAAFVSTLEKRAAVTFLVGTILTGIGSTIYHLDPRDSTLVYDRLGIVVAFMGFMAMLVHERVDTARWLLPSLLVIGIASVVWWRAVDDLRPYGFVQFFPILAIVALLILEKPRYSGEAATLISMAVLYGCAKVFELADRPIYRALGGAVSGHTLKHVAAASGAVVAVLWIARREATFERSRGAASTPVRS